jgi:hypothetical protein
LTSNLLCDIISIVKEQQHKGEIIMYNNNYNTEQRYKIDYEVDGKIKSCYPRSEADKDKSLEICKEKGYKVIKVTKLYPFSTKKNQHNFMLVKNRCHNIMYDMDLNIVPYNRREYNRLFDLAQKADKFFGLELPVAWLDYDTLKEAKRVAQMAINFRIDTCIENGRYDLIQYC